MKPTFTSFFKHHRGNKILSLPAIILCMLFSGHANAQCPGTSATANLNWDYRNYLVTTGNYAGFVTAGMSQSQNFSFGTNRLNIAMGAGITTTGQNATVTAVTGSYGSGNSVSYNGNGTVTLTFDTVVANLNFSLYDIDNGQGLSVTAKDAFGANLNVNMTSVSAGILTILGSGGTTPTATSIGNCTSTGVDYRGIVNISINGFLPAGTNGVKTVTITTSLIAGDFWLSDLAACVYRAFPTSYYQVSKPWTGQPAYTIANSNAPTASMVTLTGASAGKARFIFQDGGTGSNPWINSFGYDPYNYKLYYTYDSSGGASNVSYSTKAKYKAVKKYDFNTITTTMGTGTISTLIADVTAAPFNIPVFDQGLVSGGAAFNGGSFYLGVEGSNQMVKIGGNTGVSGRYSMIWRIDFDASGNPTQACQVFASLADDGAQHIIHDWGDFTVANGVLYDFNSANGMASYNKFYHYDLQTGVLLATYSPNRAPIPGQSAVDWNDNIYWFNSSADKMALYNGAGGIGAQTTVSGAAAIDWTTAGAGEAAEAFKPPIDYGDAPATYDPAAVDPAGHDYDSLIHLGNTWSAEFAEKVSAGATGDGASDDGLGAAPPLLNYGGTLTYTINVHVYNHTGASATVTAWLDYNFNGLFDVGEGVTSTVGSSTALQTVPLTWTSIAVPNTALTNTFLRIRTTRTANGLTTASMNGYKPDGEVEDYSVVMGTFLPVDFISFDVYKKTGSVAELKWSVIGNPTELSHFEVERSANGQDWSAIASVTGNSNSIAAVSYSYLDNEVPGGQSFYRIKMISTNGAYKYSIVKSVYIPEISTAVLMFPNPAKDRTTIKFKATVQTKATVSVFDTKGKLVMVQDFKAVPGNNQLNLEKLNTLANGLYLLRLSAGNSSSDLKLIINKD